MKKAILLCMALMSLLSCRDNLETQDVQVNGMKPVYKILDASIELETKEAKAFGELGKIVSKGNYIYINERFEGIHVIDNSDPRNPITQYFWQIEGNIDFILKDDLLYADNSQDLLTIDISNPASINLLNTVKDIYQDENEGVFPPDYFGPFECVDLNKGIVVDWEMTSLLNPKCRI